MKRRNHLTFPALVLTLTMLSAYLCAVALVAAQHLSLPRTDMAHGQSLGATFSDPFVLTIAGTGATIAGLIAFPIALFCLQRRALVRCGVFVIGLTLLFIIGATTLVPRLGLVGAPVVAFAALLFCRFSDFEFFRPRGTLNDVA
jgi:hypothetical protein